jgi:hypothetical protein
MAGARGWRLLQFAGLGGWPAILCFKTGGVVVVATSEKFGMLARNQLGDGDARTPAIAGGRICIHTSQHLISVGGKGKSDVKAGASGN